MAKVIEQGYKRFKCPSCNSIIEYEQSEVKEDKFNMDYLGYYDIRFYIKCPSCGTKNIV